MADRTFNDRRNKPTRQKVYGMWYGGGSYAAPTVDDTEEFSSMAHAKRVFDERARGRDPVSGDAFPVVDESAEMHLFMGKHPAQMHDPAPDRIIKRGRTRGSSRVERV